MIETCALVAQRPLLIVSPDRDKHFTIESVRLVYERLKTLYQNVEMEQNIGLVEFHGYHGYSSLSRKEIFSWLLRHLREQATTPEEVSDVDGVLENEANLLVYQGKNPANDEATAVQDWFIPLAEPKQIMNTTELHAIKNRVLAGLKAESFAFFPSTPMPLDLKVEQKYLERSN